MSLVLLCRVCPLEGDLVWAFRLSCFHIAGVFSTRSKICFRFSTNSPFFFFHLAKCSILNAALGQNARQWQHLYPLTPIKQLQLCLLALCACPRHAPSCGSKIGESANVVSFRKGKHSTTQYTCVVVLDRENNQQATKDASNSAYTDNDQRVVRSSGGYHSWLKWALPMSPTV